MPAPELSIVSPVFQAASIIPELVRRVAAAAALATSSYQIILVEDAGQDGSWEQIELSAARDPRIKGIRLARNVGQHRAIRVGLANTEGEHVVVLDCDLQDNPDYIPALLAKAREGFDMVLTCRQRQQPWWRQVISSGYFHLINLVSRRPVPDLGIGGYSLITRRVVASLRAAKADREPYLAALLRSPFKRALLVVVASPRFAGRSTYTVAGLVRVGLLGLFGQKLAPARPAPAVREHCNFASPPSI